MPVSLSDFVWIVILRRLFDVTSYNLHNDGSTDDEWIIFAERDICGNGKGVIMR